MMHCGSFGIKGIPAPRINTIYASLFHNLSTFNNILFVMVSGMFMLLPSNITLKDENKRIGKKILRMLGALFFFGLLYNILVPVMFERRLPTNILVIPILYKIISGNAWFHLWFLYMIIGLYLLTPVLRVFIKNASKEHIEYFLVLYFIVYACLPWYENLHISFLPQKIGLQLKELSGFAGYYIAGYYFSTYAIKKRTEICFYVLGALSLLIPGITTVYCVYTNRSPLDMGGGVPPFPWRSASRFSCFSSACSKTRHIPPSNRESLRIFQNIPSVFS
jgi:surface polysaccharide O-acyltransferase-like enzyme